MAIGDLLRFQSSSPLSRHGLLYPSPEQPPHLTSSGLAPSTPPPPPSPASPTSSFLSTIQGPLYRPAQSKKTPTPPYRPRKPQPPPKRTSARARVTTSSLLSLLPDLDGVTSSPPPDLASLVPDKGSLEVTGTKGEVEELARRLMEGTSSLEEGIDVASWILRVTEEGQRDKGVRLLVYRTIQELGELLLRLQPRPPPDPILKFLLSNQARTRLTFGPNQNPLVKLLEVYARLYIQDRRRLDPSAAAPPSHVLVELETLRLQHLDAVRSIYQAMKEVDKDVFTVRSYDSLMDAYNQGRSVQEVEEVWELMGSEGGVGIDQRAVSVYFDACGFNGSLPRALATWKDLRASGFELNENNYRAYQECLTRCGAWDELLVFLGEQQARHLVDPTTTPPLAAPGLAAIIKLANRLVYQPRHRSLRQVDREDYKRLEAKMEALVPRETWKEVITILSARTRHVVDGGVKIGNGRRPDRERPQ